MMTIRTRVVLMKNGRLKEAMGSEHIGRWFKDLNKAFK